MLEAIFSIALFALVVTMMASLMNLVLNSERFKGSKHRTGEIAVSLLYRMAQEASTANHWNFPSASGASDQLSFESPDWEDQATVLPVPLPTPLPTDWEPEQASLQVRIEYWVNAQSLQRRLSADGDEWTTTLLKDVVGFTTRRSQGRYLYLSLTLNSEEGPRSYQIESVMPDSLWKYYP